jgi:PadR family transcriptional regulator PadR
MELEESALRASAVRAVPTLPPKEALILELLVQEKDMYGLQLVAASRRRLKRGTVYVTLGRMEEKGYILSRLEPAPPDAGGLPRRVYEATAFGRRVLKAWTLMAQQLVPELVR